MPNQPPLNPDALARHQWAHDFNSCDCGKSIPTIIDSENCVYVPNDKAMAKHQIEMAAVAQPVVNSVEELDKLPVGSVIIDKYGDLGLIDRNGTVEKCVQFAGTIAMSIGYAAKHFLPARVLYRRVVES